MLAFILGFFKNWKLLLAGVVVIAVAYGGFAIYRFIDELHDEQAKLEKTIKDKDREIGNLTVELNQERARLETISTILTQKDADLAESKRVKDLLEGKAADAAGRITQLRRQLNETRIADRERLYSADPTVADAELEAINQDANCKFKLIAGGKCE